MHYGELKTSDIANGTGVRTSLFVSGCTHRCHGCFQPATWDFEYGKEYTPEVEERIMESLKPPFVRGLSILGGEPWEPSNQRALIGLLRRVRRELPDKDVWAYSGYTWEELTGDSRARCEVTDEMLSLVDVIVDGEYVESRRNIGLSFRGSENQRILDVRASLAEGRPVELDLDRVRVQRSALRARALLQEFHLHPVVLRGHVQMMEVGVIEPLFLLPYLRFELSSDVVADLFEGPTGPDSSAVFDDLLQQRLRGAVPQDDLLPRADRIHHAERFARVHGLIRASDEVGHGMTCSVIYAID